MTLKNLLTVDVEDWYHICDIEPILPPSQWDQCESRVLGNVEKILALFSRYKTKATFFILGYVAERTPEVVRIIRQEGHEIASHGYGHLQVYKQNKDEFLKDLLRSKSVIEKMIGEKVDRISCAGMVHLQGEKRLLLGTRSPGCKMDFFMIRALPH